MKDSRILVESAKSSASEVFKNLGLILVGAGSIATIIENADTLNGWWKALLSFLTLGGVNIWIPAAIGVSAIGIFWWAALTQVEIIKTSNKGIFWLWNTMATSVVIWFIQSEAVDTTYAHFDDLGVYATTVVILLKLPYVVAVCGFIIGLGIWYLESLD